MWIRVGRDKYILKCDVCGKFCKYEDHDEYTPFGNTGDIDPPEPRIMCGECAGEKKNYYIKNKWLPSNWIPSGAEKEAAKVLGFAQAGPKMAARSVWHKKSKPLPDDYVWRKEVKIGNETTS